MRPYHATNFIKNWLSVRYKGLASSVRSARKRTSVPPNGGTFYFLGSPPRSAANPLSAELHKQPLSAIYVFSNQQVPGFYTLSLFLHLHNKNLIKADKESFPLTLIGYNKEQKMVFARLVGDGDIDLLIPKLFEEQAEIEYFHVRNAEACCFICKVEKV